MKISHISNNELSEPFSGYITRQDDARIAADRYGKSRMKVQTVGCGPVALYNIMRRLGKPQGFGDIIRDAQRLNMPWLFGLFGTKPHSPGRFFRLHGVEFKQTDDCGEARKQLALADCAMICTWCGKRTDGIHFFAVLNDGGRLRALNRFNADSLTPFSADDIREDRFITGYFFSAPSGDTATPC